MYIVAIAWIYVALMMAIAEAANPIGSLLGAFFTFVLYGLLPVGIVVYLMGAPARRKAIKAREEAAARSGSLPDGSGEAPAAAADDSVAAMGKK